MSPARVAAPASSRRNGAGTGEAPALQSGASGQPPRPARERSTRASSIAEAVSRWLDQEL